MCFRLSTFLTAGQGAHGVVWTCRAGRRGRRRPDVLLKRPGRGFGRGFRERERYVRSRQRKWEVKVGCINSYMGVSKNSGTQKWMVYFMENPF